MLALMSIGMDAALGAAGRERAAGHAVSDHAAVSSAASTIMLAVQPLLASGSTISRDAEVAAWTGYWLGHDTPESVALGQAIGRQVADAVLGAAATDGAADAPRAELTEYDANGDPVARAPGVWVPTGRMNKPGADPLWGQVRPLVLQSGAAARVPAPPAWDSAEFATVRSDFKATADAVSASDVALAWKWDLRPSTPTPVGAWYLIARDLVLRDKLSASDAARIFAVLGAAINDSVIACWESKYHYRVARPIQWMQAEFDPMWLPVLGDTPNHPSYPSGHSAISAAAATVLGQYFPQDAAALEAQAHDASRSRVVGGIHWPLDIDAGAAQGRQVAEQVLAALASTTREP
jgi:membrane-associated phospholipid phosphatase